MNTLNSARIAQACNFNADKVAQVFINALTHCNFHAEARIIETIWEAMAEADYGDSDDAPKLIAAARDALLDGEALKALGVTDDDIEAVENLYNFLSDDS